MQKCLAMVVVAAGLGLGSACKQLECGAGTIEMDDQCVASVNPGAACAPGTTFNSTSGRCESDLFTAGGGICGDGTAQLTNDAGVRVCIGTGSGGAGCATPLPCPPPSMSNTVSLCGRIYDLEDSAPLDDGNADNGEPSKSVTLVVLDPLAFITNPNPPILKTAMPDSCGRFAIIDAPRPSAGFISVATTGPDMVICGVAAAVEVGEIVSGMRAFVFKKSTDMAWSTSAGLTGDTFGTRGVYVPIFLSPGGAVAPFPQTPTAGVQVAILNESGVRTVKAENDFYFSDTVATTRRAVSASQGMTGANGTGIYINQPGLGNFSGLGNAPPGTCWAVNPAAAPKGGAFVQERTAESRFCP